jgi:hypothetical protein
MENPLSELLRRLQEAAGPMIGQLVFYGVVALVVLVIFYLLWKVLGKKRREPPPLEPDLAIDVESLGTAGPPAVGPTLEHYYVPVRLAAIVVAPAGRAGWLPPFDQLNQVFEAIVPGLAQIVALHKPVIRRWPEQLSTSGFAHAFFRHVQLPGDGGKGTPWCSLAGVAKIRGQAVMAGLVVRAELANSFGQTLVEQETKWLDILRVKRREL